MIVVVPVYVFPEDQYIVDLLDQAVTPVLPSIIVLNLNNGDGDMSSLDEVSDGLRARYSYSGMSGLVLGYVYTSLAGRPIGTVEACIDAWLSQRGGSTHYDGIFVDEVSRDAGTGGSDTSYRDYYLSIRQYINTNYPANNFVMNNPGTAIDYRYLDGVNETANIFLTFEGSLSTYSQIASAENGFVGFAGGNIFDSEYRSGPSDKFCHLVYGVPDFVAASSVISVAYGRNAAFLLATDDELPNPWDVKPTYLNALISAVSPDPVDTDVSTEPHHRPMVNSSVKRGPYTSSIPRHNMSRSKPRAS